MEAGGVMRAWCGGLRCGGAGVGGCCSCDEVLGLGECRGGDVMDTCDQVERWHGVLCACGAAASPFPLMRLVLH